MKTFVTLLLFALTLLADAHIFVYHRFGDARHPSTNTSIAVLKKQFDYFKNHGYDVIPLSTLVETLEKGKHVPDNWVVLTIDDSYRSFFENALPLFRRYGYPFTLFVYTGATERRYGDFMTWKQINEAKKYGELGFHSHSHPHMVSKSDDYLAEDFKKGLALMAKRTGERAKYFAYPYGEYDKRVKKIAESFGFDAICNQNVGAVSDRSSRFDLDRIALTGDTSLKEKLAIRFLPAEWIEPSVWPEHGIVHRVRIKIGVPTAARRAQLYLTGYGWEWVDVRNGEIDAILDKPLKNRRSRLILKLEKDKINTKILVKP
ncbi:polysaccharide deacetylase family protein [Hydrogenimonas urashimensis]|uniref:polysaccharide deacetylase family protein n=1 Tax=Hydrogenimonas urashimensis TaxID=2740515 RepID=UPI0019168CBA|nr:polysaccharide deacetylase family protein [Hydrogenimonas urashimensis]